MSVWTAMRTWLANDEMTVARIQAIADNITVSAPVGQIIYCVRSATTVETVVNDAWLECNGVSVLRADYPDLNTLLGGLTYPFGTADATHMTLPDLQGRELIAMASGGHTNVNGLGDSDGLAKASRNPKESVSFSGSASVSGSVSGGTVSGTTGSSGTHSHTVSSSGGGPGSSGSLVAAGSTSSDGAHTHSFSGSLSGATFSGSGSVSGSDSLSGNYLVAGVYLIKAVA